MSVGVDAANSAALSKAPIVVGYCPESIEKRDGAVTRLTLNRPGKANALSAALVEALIEALGRAAADDARLVVLDGAGSHFCAGFDFTDYENATDGDLVLRFIRIETLLQQLNINPVDIGNRQFFYGRGCPVCNNTGYKGRMGIFEWLAVSEPIRDLIMQRAPTLMIRQRALERGMRTLRDDGLRAIFDGATSLEEIIKYT